MSLRRDIMYILGAPVSDNAKAACLAEMCKTYARERVAEVGLPQHYEDREDHVMCGAPWGGVSTTDDPEMATCRRCREITFGAGQ